MRYIQRLAMHLAGVATPQLAQLLAAVMYMQRALGPAEPGATTTAPEEQGGGPAHSEQDLLPRGLHGLLVLLQLVNAARRLLRPALLRGQVRAGCTLHVFCCGFQIAAPRQTPLCLPISPARHSRVGSAAV